MTTISGTASFMALMELCTGPSASKALDPVSSLTSGIPKSMSAGTPSEWSSLASFTILSTESWNWPGMEAISFLTSLPYIAKSGYIRSSGVSTVSLSILLIFSVFLSLLGL